MAYKVIVPDSAKKQLAKIDTPSQKRIIQFLVTLGEAENPRLSGIAMQSNSHLWRYRVGDYRLIADINDGIITITIVKIGHRREVYR